MYYKKLQERIDQLKAEGGSQEEIENLEILINLPL